MSSKAQKRRLRKKLREQMLIAGLNSKFHTVLEVSTTPERILADLESRKASEEARVVNRGRRHLIKVMEAGKDPVKKKVALMKAMQEVPWESIRAFNEDMGEYEVPEIEIDEFSQGPDPAEMRAIFRKAVFAVIFTHCMRLAVAKKRAIVNYVCKRRNDEMSLSTIIEGYAF